MGGLITGILRYVPVFTQVNCTTERVAAGMFNYSLSENFYAKKGPFLIKT